MHSKRPLPESIDQNLLAQQEIKDEEKIRNNPKTQRAYDSFGASGEALKEQMNQEEMKYAISTKQILRGIQKFTIHVTAYTGAAVSVLIIISWVLNLILPDKYKWLSQSNEQELTSLVGIILSYTAGIFAKIGIKRD